MKQETLSKGQRLSELSFLNVFFCFLVMFIHVSSEPVTALLPGSWQGMIVTLCWRFCSFVVPGFLFLSGLKLFLNRQGPIDLTKYYVRRFRTIYEPYLFAVLLYNCLFAAIPYYSYSVKVPRLLHYIFLGDLVSHFYYIVILVQFTILLPLWLWMMKRGRRRVWLAVSLVLTLLCSVVLPGIPAVSSRISFAYNDRVFSSYLFYWVLGCVCGAEYDKAKALVFRLRGVILVFFCAALIADPVLFVLNRAGKIALPAGLMGYLHYIYCIAAVLFFFTAVIWFGGRTKQKALPPVISAIDRASYPIYLWHCAFIYIVDEFMREAWFPWQAISVRYAVRILFVMVGTPLVCIVSQKIRRWADGVSQR
ncbi:MAG: acyltransferase [Clostridia bacterium]|nr:acyltransferase [Clostridia bacterium]